MSGNFWQGHTVTLEVLQIAFTMAFERVFLVGVDHIFKQAGRANEIQTMKQADENHFDPSYFRGSYGIWSISKLPRSPIVSRSWSIAGRGVRFLTLPWTAS